MAAVKFAQAHSPVMPLADGTWTPLLPPWVEYTGGITFYADGGNWFSHGAFASRSSLTGPLYLALHEVLDCKSREIELMLKSNQHPITRENAGLSQPYYCRHDFAHLKRGEVKLFLKTYYNQMTALQDRETYTFWEHYYFASQHKTHEEGWFLMQTRWMLYLEDGDALDVFKGIPRKWLEEGKKLELKGVKSYFGALHVQAQLKNNVISCSFKSEKKPSQVRIRLPHPERRLAVACEGGIYDADNECVHAAGQDFVIQLEF